ncbi:ABC transporter substrate-binding protein [Paenibacillus thermotolerans]|uniref:ABC transporter substrate-binding protein n=1 Tax=Paenibacillus thermotolerans TaxID=3027807 RepID=UPI002367AB96|nr:MULTISPECIES: extracellular solute-binding protein [unclassified Paenibacillus]
MLKKGFIVALVLMIAILAGCSGGSKPEQTAGEPSQEGAAGGETKELTVWWWGDQEAPGAQAWMDETVQKFEEANPGIKIKTVLQSTDQLVPAFKAAAMAGQGPDIQYFWGGVWTLENAWSNVIVPVSDYIPQDELSHYINTSERTYDGKVWGTSWYLSDNAIPYRKDVFEKAGLDPNNPPKTWDEFMAANEKIKQAGYIPLAVGLKDGWLGGWMWQLLGKQNLDSHQDLIKAVVGEADFKDSKYSEWLTKIAELKEKGYMNDDALSLDYQQGQELFATGKAAMVFGNDTFFPQWIKDIGEDKIGIMNVPTYGTGAMADTITVTAQGFGITSWSEHKEEAAQFLIFMHTQDRLDAWYEKTGVFPADDRFDPNKIATPQMKQIFEMVKAKPSVNLENFIPSMVEEQSVLSGVQQLLTGEKTPEDIAQLMNDISAQWREMTPDMVTYYQKWVE